MTYTIIKYNFFIAILLLLFNFPAKPDNNSESENENSNYISIQGSSNVNEFQFISSSSNITEYLSETDTNPQYRNIRIAVDGFSAENKKMVQDFREMVNAEEYPYIGISIERRELADFEETSGMTNFSTIITIAGVSQEYTVPCEVFSRLNSGYSLNGSFSVKLTDFEIDPPEKLLGLIKVNNEVFINFLFNFDSEEVLTKK